MRRKFRLIDEVPSGDILGEGVQWHGPTGSIWWTDILGQKLCCYKLDERQLKKYTLPEPVGSFAFTEEKGILLCAFSTGFAFYNPETGDRNWIDRPTFNEGEGRFNDGRVDPYGRFWSGTMVVDPVNSTRPSARLFSFDLDHQVKKHLDNIYISNGLCWSPCGKILYFADSPTGQINQYDFDVKSGMISNKRFFARVPEGGGPDGANVDAEGNLWSACWGLGKVLVFNPDGIKVEEVDVPASQPTCIAFGGPKLNLLLVTSATEGLDKKQLENQPSAGNLFIYETCYRGNVEKIFKGKVI